jgi:hypothetical protein
MSHTWSRIFMLLYWLLTAVGSAMLTDGSLPTRLGNGLLIAAFCGAPAAAYLYWNEAAAAYYAALEKAEDAEEAAARTSHGV